MQWAKAAWKAARGGGFSGAAAREANEGANATRAELIIAGCRWLIGAVRTKRTVPTIGLGLESQPRIEELFWPGMPVGSQFPLFCPTSDAARLCTGQRPAEQQAGKLEAAIVSAKPETQDKRSASRARNAPNFRAEIIMPACRCPQHTELKERKQLPDRILDVEPALTVAAAPANMRCMAHTFLLFDFASNEEAAQQARHRIEGWKQGFRLGKKIEVKFERSELAEAAAGKPEEKAAASVKGSKPKGKSKPKASAKAKSAEEDNDGAEEATATSGSTNIRLIVRLDFSDHEKLSHQRWVERIPSEEPFKSASPKILRANDSDFRAISDLFDSLD